MSRILQVLNATRQKGSLASSRGAPVWQDNFASGSITGSVLTTGSGNTWTVSEWTNTDYALAGSDVTWQAANISFTNGMLRMLLTQATASTSTGAEIVLATGTGTIGGNGTLGYGAYEYLARAASTDATGLVSGLPISGGVSAAFTILTTGSPNYYSTTELDIFQVEGAAARDNVNDIEVYSSTGSSQLTGTVLPSSEYTMTENNPWNGYNYYGAVWSAVAVKFYLNGILVGTCTNDIPSVAAPLDINLWGTNLSTFGGLATTGTSRYMFVKSAKYWTS